MYKLGQICFRKDLVVTRSTGRKGQSKAYLIKDPISNQVFQFREEEYFLCQSIDGILSVQAIQTKFKERFGFSLSESDFNRFFEQISSCGLLESNRELAPPQSPGLLKNSLRSQAQTAFDPAESEENQEAALRAESELSDPPRGLEWTFDADPVLVPIAAVLSPFGGFFKALAWCLVPGVLVVSFTLTDNRFALFQDTAAKEKPLSFLGLFLIHFVFATLVSRVLQAIVYACHGGRMSTLRLRLRFGFIPRFQIDRNLIFQLGRKEQLWTFGTPLLLMLSVFVAGTLLWYIVRGSGSGLSSWAILLAYVGLLSFLLKSFPLRPASDGNRWLAAYFSLPPSWLRQSLKRGVRVAKFVLSRRPLPQPLSTRDLGLMLFAPALLIIWGLLLFRIVRRFSSGLEQIFPGIFGRATRFVLVSLLLLLVLRWLSDRWLKFSNRSRVRKRQTTGTEVTLIEPEEDRLDREHRSNSWAKRFSTAALILGLCVVLLLPYPYHPGGPVQLLPPKQQPIQAPFAGKVTQALVKGGNGQWLTANTVLATLQAVELENNVLTLQQNVNAQQAKLDKLLATPRPEEVVVAQKEVEASNKQVEVAKSSLAAAVARANLSAREVGRLGTLYREGAYSLQLFEEAQTKAQIDRINVMGARDSLDSVGKSLEKKQADLKLILSGSHPDDIKEARAELNRLQQELTYAKDQLKRTQLVMPFEGYVITPYLERKVGSYLRQGDTFAVAEDARNVLGEVQVPEYDLGSIAVGANVQIRLLAYANESIVGRVVSVEPVAVSESEGRVVKVVVEIPASQKLLKQGMTGYAKIEAGTRPVIVAFTQPITRFVQVEMWSWLP